MNSAVRSRKAISSGESVKSNMAVILSLSGGRGRHARDWLSNNNDIPLFDEEGRERPGKRCFNLHIGLVGDDLCDDIARFKSIAGFFQPCGEGNFLSVGIEIGENNVLAHDEAPSRKTSQLSVESVSARSSRNCPAGTPLTMRWS